jgi:small subunit ribosomal protein S20
MAKKQTSAEKRHRQSVEHHARNQAVKTGCKTAAKKVIVALDKKDVSTAEAALKETIRKLDKAQSKGVLHRNTVARKKSRMQRKVNAAKAVSAGTGTAQAAA